MPEIMVDAVERCSGGPLDLMAVFPAAREAGEVLIRRGWSLATGESCTGGLVAAALAAAPEATRFLRGGVVAYHPAVKERVMGVDPQVIERDGVVSEVVARRLAAGARRALGADVGVGTTGLVGGGDEGKPPGLTFVAVVTPLDEEVVCLTGDEGPAANCERAVSTCLDVLLRLTRVGLGLTG